MKLQRIPAGRIVNAHGVRGEVRVLPRDGDPALLRRFHTFLLDTDVFPGRRVTPLSVRVHKGFALMKFPGVDSCDSALALKGTELYLDRAEAPEGMIFDAELLGMEVYDGETGTRLGEITQVETYPASKVYTVRGKDASGRKQTYLIPAVEGAFIRSVDIEANRMEIQMWEGLAVDGD